MTGRSGESSDVPRPSSLGTGHAALLVGIGGAIGTLARYGLTEWSAPLVLINVAGSLLLGVLVGAGIGRRPLLVAGTGFCGGFTTYSAFAHSIVAADQSGGHAFSLVAGTVFGGLLAAGVGLLVGARMAGARR